MPVRNARKYVDEAIQSILDQTWSDFEFVILDDASTDGSWERLEEWAWRDPRIQLHRSEKVLGPAVSSNQVVQFASAPIIARMDADDISVPDRLERQAEVLSGRSDAGIVASVCEFIDSNGNTIRPAEPWRLSKMSWRPPFSHGSIMFHRTLFDSLGGYRPECAFWEDLDLMRRAAEKTRILVIPRPLYRWRHSTSGTRLASDQDRVEKALDLRYRALDRIRQGRSYEDLLNAASTKHGERVDPRVFVSLGLLELWSGARPKLSKHFFKRARIGFDLPTLTAMGFLAGATLAPALMRTALGSTSRIKSALFRSQRPPEDVVEWKTPSKTRTRRPSHQQRA